MDKENASKILVNKGSMGQYAEKKKQQAYRVTNLNRLEQFKCYTTIHITKRITYNYIIIKTLHTVLIACRYPWLITSKLNPKYLTVLTRGEN